MEVIIYSIELVVLGLEVVATIVIVLGLARATLRYLSDLRTASARTAYIAYRHSIARAIIIGLEFMIAADIIKTVTIAPSLANVAILAAIVLIRTFLSIMLHVEAEGSWPWGLVGPDQRKDE